MCAAWRSLWDSSVPPPISVFTYHASKAAIQQRTITSLKPADLSASEPSRKASEPSCTSSLRSVNNVEADGVPRQRTVARNPS